MTGNAAKNKILKLLEKGEMSTSQIASETRRSYLDTVKILRELLSKKVILKNVDGNAVYWRLKHEKEDKE